uniref:PiggyBac transposable element-derived protein domain-containing protein n=1 Tax=Lates calcarifer TaxID=8187 RepID=A0A4W6G6E2_LATCA
MMEIIRRGQNREHTRPWPGSRPSFKHFYNDVKEYGTTVNYFKDKKQTILRRSRMRSRSPHRRLEPWRTGNDPDTALQISQFMPWRAPGAQVDTHAAYSPLDLFQLYFSPTTVEELYKFPGLLIYTRPVSPPSMADYWKQKNEEKKGTPGHEKLFRIRPLIDHILSACQAHYHPRKDLAVDERMVATKAKTGMTQFMNDKPTRWGFKLFVLPSYLGTGYHVYLDNFYTSPQLFFNLASMTSGVCGTYRDNRKGCPTGRKNALTRKSERGTVRWIREGSLVFVKWMDTWEVSIGSTIHPAVSREVVKRRVKEKDGHWAVKNISCPALIILIQYYSTYRRTACWYRTLFLHLVDIATTSAYILHRDISASNQVKPMSHRDFQTELVSQLCGVDSTGVPTKRSADHIPIAIAMVIDASLKVTQGCRICQRCHQVDKKRNLTSWKCQSCNVALCLIVDRNFCFEELQLTR